MLRLSRIQIERSNDGKLEVLLHPENPGQVLYAKIKVNALGGFLIALALTQNSLLVKMREERGGRIYFYPIPDTHIGRDKLSADIVAHPNGSFSREFNVWYENFKKETGSTEA
jgi:hypothetical protein